MQVQRKVLHLKNVLLLHYHLRQRSKIIPLRFFVQTIPMNRLERESCSAEASTIPAFHLHCTKIESEGNYFASLPLTFIGCRSTYCFNLLSYFSVNAKIINIIIFDDCFFHCAFKYKVVLFQYFSGGNIRFVYQPCDSDDV